MKASILQTLSSDEFNLISATVLILLLFSLPWVVSRMLAKSKRSKAEAQKRYWILGETVLSVGILASMLAVINMVVVSRNIIAPWIWDAPPLKAGFDEPLTARLLFYWATVAVLGWGTFKAVGATALRDVHKTIKELHDLVEKHRR